MGTCNRYDSVMWLSYAKNRLDSGVAAEMQLHSLSCTDCQARLDFSRKIAAIVDLSSAAPPDSWMEEAAAKFESVGASHEPSEIFAELVFDSYLHDKEAVRSRTMETRHLVFDLPRFEIDLAIEFSGRQLNMLVGRLFSKAGEPFATLEEFGLELRVANHTYATLPNMFGEFSFTIAEETTGEPLEIRCTFKEGPCFVLLIPC